ncbi:MAG: hypothetical protein J5916_05965 [Oscillospiraceae bacterium]|nr:hypothetical protein [Oscillospiraceae bacterium]
MSLSRTDLKLIGLNDDQISSVIAAHSETVSALKQKYSELETKYSSAKESADRLLTVQKELDELKKSDFKSMYESEQRAHNALKESVSREKARTAKEKAARAYYEGKNIRGNNLAIAMRGTDLDQLQLDDSGNLADTAALDALVEGDFKPLVTTRRTVSSGGTLAGHPEPTSSSNEVMNRLFRGL